MVDLKGRGDLGMEIIGGGGVRRSSELGGGASELVNHAILCRLKMSIHHSSCPRGEAPASYLSPHAKA